MDILAMETWRARELGVNYFIKLTDIVIRKAEHLAEL
jgi:hypothetical protein